MIELKNINKLYNPGTVNEMCLFENLNLTVQEGEFVSVVGSNGSGKTSMLNIIRRLRNAKRRINAAFFVFKIQMTPHLIWYNRVD